LQIPDLIRSIQFATSGYSITLVIAHFPKVGMKHECFPGTPNTITTTSAALRSVGFLDVLLSTPAESSRRAGKSRQMRLVSMPACAASLRSFMINPG
jgi:hypothetical protein